MNGKILLSQLRKAVFRPGGTCGLVLALVFLSSTYVFAQGQSATRNYSITNATISEAVDQILSGTQYRVVYSVGDLEKQDRISVELKNATVGEALREVLKNSGLTYEIRDRNTVVISRTTTSPTANIRGVVYDAEFLNPIRGAAVFDPRSNRGTVTDAKGRFEIKVALGDKIHVSLLGKKPQTVTADKNEMNIIIRLENAAVDVGEIVVTGYSTTSKIRTPGSVAVITAEELQDAPLQSLDMLLQGKVAGVSVQAVSGKPGESAKVRIRGTNTLTGNAEPLWVVNGVPLDREASKKLPSASNIRTNDLSSLYMDGIAGINPEDIESVTILKDASAAAIYGSRAAGGVIVVTTKKGKSGGMRVGYSGSVSLTTRPVRTVDLMNSREKLDFEQELWDEFSKERFLHNQDPASITQLRVPYIGITGMVRGGLGRYAGWSEARQDEYLASLAKHSTDWFDQLFRHAVSTKHHVSVSGGSNKMDYYVSMGYDNKKGLLKQNQTDGMSFNSSLGVMASGKVRIDFMTSVGFQKAKEPSQATNPFRYAFFANPYERPYDDEGGYKPDETFYTMYMNNSTGFVDYPDNGFNLMRELEGTKLTTKNFSASENMQLKWDIRNGLSFSGMAALFYNNHVSENINSADTYTAFTDRPFESGYGSQRKYGSISQSATTSYGYTLRGQFNYSNMFGGKHYVTALAGTEITWNTSKNIYSKRYGYDPLTGGSVSPILPPSGSNESDIGRITKLMDGLTGQFIDKQAMASFYFDADYTYDKRYTVKLSLRTDGSNNFGHDKQFNPIWSAGFSWNLMEEEFMSPLGKVFSMLVFRTSMGYTGNINKNIYPKLVLEYFGNYRYIDNEYFRIGKISGAPNPNLGWERTFDYKFNIDMGMLDSRLGLSLEYYRKKSDRIVSMVSIPSPTGFDRYQYNTSTIVNQGVELTLNAAILKNKDHSLRLTVNGAYNKNELTKYNAPNKVAEKLVGYPTDALFAGEYLGINPYNGLYEFRPRSDASFLQDSDYELEKNFLRYIGPGTSPFTGGFTLAGSYKNFGMAVSGSFSVGRKFINDISTPGSAFSFKDTADGTRPQTSRNDLYTKHYNGFREQQRRWTPDNPVTDGYPRIVDYYDGIKVDGKVHMTDYDITRSALIENVSYLKFSSISLTYKPGEKVLKTLGLKSAGVSFLMNNLFTISNYSGIDPETPGAIYPQSKSFSLSLNIGF